MTFDHCGMVKIERGVPLDTERYVRYPFDKMKVGDSFFVELDTKRVASAASKYRRAHMEFKFAVRKVSGGTRVWRVPA